MNPRNTWTWIIVALLLFAAIVCVNQLDRKVPAGPALVLPDFKAGTVTSVQVLPTGQQGIRVNRTNAAWQLTDPIAYPGQAASIEGLLNTLEQLTAAAEITPGELRRHTNADAEFGFASPQVSLVMHSRYGQKKILVGAPTAPGDQVYLQVVGAGVYVVDAEFLKKIPRSADDWRDTAFLDLRALAFDRITITNAAAAIEVQRDPGNGLWTMVYPMRGARADSVRVTNLLQALHALRVAQFVPNDPKAEVETFGLQPAELNIALAQGTNIVTLVQFGKSPASNTNLVFARRQGLGTVVIVAKDPSLPWRAAFNEFRDPRLVTLAQPVDQIEFRNGESFTLQLGAGDKWRVAAQDFPVDAGLVRGLIQALGNLQIVEFKDAITEADLPGYGLTNAARQVFLRTAVTNAAGPTNQLIAALAFGATKDDRVWVRRADEHPVYGVRLADVQQLPTAAWQLHERRIWNFTENDVTRVTIQEGGRVRQMTRGGANSWALAPGSQGEINVFAVEETMHRLGELAATLWVERGEPNLARYGFSTNGLALTVELKSGEKAAIEFGGFSPAQYPYAATKLNGQTWVFEFPLGLYHYVSTYLKIPPGVP